MTITFNAQLKRLHRLERACTPPQQWSAPLDPVEMAKEAGIELDDWQCDVVRSQHPRILINASRQSGKSTSAAVLAVHTVLSEENALVLCVAPGLRQASLLYSACLTVYRGLGRPVSPRQENALSLGLRNGSAIIAIPGNEAKIRGYSGVRLLLADESSRIPNDLVAAIRPMLAVSGGRMVSLSTPWGRRGWWSDAWHSSENYERYEIPAPLCKRISTQFLEEERRAMSRYYFESEYLCKFLMPEGAVFSPDDIAALADTETEAWTFNARPTRTMMATTLTR